MYKGILRKGLSLTVAKKVRGGIKMGHKTNFKRGSWLMRAISIVAIATFVVTNSVCAAGSTSTLRPSSIGNSPAISLLMDRIIGKGVFLGAELKPSYRALQEDLYQEVFVDKTKTFEKAVAQRWNEILQLSLAIYKQKLREKSSPKNVPLTYDPKKDFYKPGGGKIKEDALLGRGRFPYIVEMSESRGKRPGKPRVQAKSINAPYNPAEDIMINSAEREPEKNLLWYETGVFGKKKKVLIVVNPFPLTTGHYEIVEPESMRQCMKLDFLRCALQLIYNHLPNTTIFYNSIGANASQNHPHFQVFPNEEVPLDDLQAKSITTRNRIKMSRITAEENPYFPVEGFVVEPVDKKNVTNATLDNLSLIAQSLIEDFMLMNIPHNVIFRHGRIYLFPKKPLCVNDFGRSYAGFEYTGHLALTASELVYTDYAKRKGVTLEKFNKMIEDDTEDEKNKKKKGMRVADFVKEVFKEISVKKDIQEGFRRSNLEAGQLDLIQAKLSLIMQVLGEIEKVKDIKDALSRVEAVYEECENTKGDGADLLLALVQIAAVKFSASDLAKAVSHIIENRELRVNDWAGIKELEEKDPKLAKQLIEERQLDTPDGKIINLNKKLQDFEKKFLLRYLGPVYTGDVRKYALSADLIVGQNRFKVEKLFARSFNQMQGVAEKLRQEIKDGRRKQEDKFKVGILFAVRDDCRIFPKSPENRTGEDSIRVKIEQLEELFAPYSDVLQWQLVVVDNYSAAYKRKWPLPQTIVDEVRKEKGLDAQQLMLIAVPEGYKPAGYDYIMTKGGTVQYGMNQLEDKTDIFIFTDADTTTDLRQTGALIAPIVLNGKHVCVGSRAMKEAMPLPPMDPQDKLIGAASALLKKQFLLRPLMVDQGVSDTQCGFKAFSKEAVKKIFTNFGRSSTSVKDAGWAFDTELLMLALREGYKIASVPILWCDSKEASMVNVKTRWGMLHDWVTQYERRIQEGWEIGLIVRDVETLTPEQLNMLKDYIKEALQALAAGKKSGTADEDIEKDQMKRWLKLKGIVTGWLASPKFDFYDVLHRELVSLGATPEKAQDAIEKLKKGEIKLYREYLEVIDKKGDVIGVMDRNLVHKTGLLHRTANAFVVTPDGKILLQRRPHNKTEPYRFSIYGGHVGIGDDYEAAIIDELKNELGLPSLKGRLVRIGEEQYTDPKGNNNEHRALYVYILMPDEYRSVKKAAAELEKMKSEITRKNFEGLLETAQKIDKYEEERKQIESQMTAKKFADLLKKVEKTGGGEIYGRLFVELSEIFDAKMNKDGRFITITEPFRDSKAPEDVNLTSDLLERLAGNEDVMDKLLIARHLNRAIEVNHEDILKFFEEKGSPFNVTGKKFLNVEINLSNVDSRNLAYFMGWLMDHEIDVSKDLKDLVMKLYYKEQNSILLNEAEYKIKADNSKYDKDGKVVGFEGVTTVANIPPNRPLSKLFSELVVALNRWQDNNLKDKHILATVPIGSEHITTYDAICKDDWAGKYEKQFNTETINEIETLVRQLTAGKSLFAEQVENIRKQAAYEVVARRISEALQEFEAGKRPVFKPIGIAAFPPHFVTAEKTVLILNVGPTSAEDLVVLTKMQEAIRKATGITNFGPFKGHITLGYFINDMTNISYGALEEFKKFIFSLNEEYIKGKEGKRSKRKGAFTMPSIELSYFNNMAEFPSIASFSWTDRNHNMLQKVDVAKQIYQIQDAATKASSAGKVLSFDEQIEKAEEFLRNSCLECWRLRIDPQGLSLDLSRAWSAKLAPFKDLKNLKWLDLRHTNIADLTPLKHLENLKELDLRDTMITSLIPLKYLKNLERLYLSNNRITSLIPLKYLKNLKWLDLSNTWITNLTPLKDLKNLERLDLSSNGIPDKQIYSLFQTYPDRKNLVVIDGREKIRYHNVPAEYKQPKPASPDTSAKSSSAGTFEALDKEILAAQDILLGAKLDELNYKHIEQTLTRLKQLRSQIHSTAKTELTDKERMTLYSRIQAQENILNHMLIADAAARVGSDGQIIFDPLIIPDAKQRNAVVRQFRAVQTALEGSMSIEDKDKASTQVCLLEDILSDKVKLTKNAMLISNKQKLQKARLLKIDGGITEENGLFVTPYLIALARGCLSINTNNYNKLIHNINRLYTKITGHPMSEKTKNDLKEGSWNIFELVVNMLPTPWPLDKDYIERLQRQAWYALIAA